ncbi:hypothetical protein [Streptomyces griseus]|uniref:hypothetical protein n=1 Tax=Streptomyces griseus TaxID=1911 RepID=UPI0004CBF3CD|nr:hypothetical protein [Streptomyces griseus]
MRGDDTQPAVARSGPRHAAPRRTLLNRIQGPAGKAMALAAMPTAVFVGMGLAPNPALADEKDIPFAPGPCVTRSDEPVAEETTATPTAKATETAKPDPTATATASPRPTGEATATPSATASATAGPTATATPEPTATGAAQGGAQEVAAGEKAAATATAAPTPTKSANPLDPLGVGDALKDLFGGLAPKQEPTATPSATPSTTASATATPSPSATTAAPRQKAAEADEPPATETDEQKPVDKAEDKPATDAEKRAEKAKAAIEEAAEKAGAKVQELPESARGLDAKKDTDIPEGAKPRFPCPEPDPAALAAADLEQGIPLLPDDPWRLDTTLLTLKGLKYHGIVEVKTSSGQIKKVLKFTAKNGVDIKDLHQTTVHSPGYKGHVRSDRGSTSTITGGTVTMYTESIKGNLFGIIPIEFTPQSPPPLDVPLAIFSNAVVIQAGQFGGTLRIPGLRNTIEPG